jgi:hypothetical protein
MKVKTGIKAGPALPNSPAKTPPANINGVVNSHGG